jgi:hypothetical protein
VKLSVETKSVPLPAGRSLIEVAFEPGSYVSVGVFGPRDGLLGFDVVGPRELRALRAHGPLDEDGLLPRVLSFRAPEHIESIVLMIDVADTVELGRVALRPPEPPPFDPRATFDLKADPAPVVGLPAPVSRDDGYLLQSPARYQFLRVDVARLMLAAFRKTRVRFRRDPIAIGDISQWDGLRPATDLGMPRHISHEGGRDIDMALPADDGEPSVIRRHCSGVLVEADVQGCAPGTVRGFDALRLAFFLGFLFDGAPHGMIEKIYTDDVYVREIRRAAETLKERRWIKDAGWEGLFDDRIVRASPWHTDHVHIRFAGRPGRPPF